MALTKVGFFTSPTTTGNFDVTGLGFQPTGIILYQINSAGGTDAVAAAAGASDGTNNAAWNTVGTGRTATTSARSSATNRVIYRSGASGVIQSEATATMIADGFRLNFTTATNSMRWGYIAFNGVPFKVGTFTVGATGAASVTGVGFKPEAIMFQWLVGNVTSSTAFGQGMVDSALAQFGVTGNNDGGTGSRTVTAAGALAVTSPSTTAIAASITALGSDGFSYNATTVASSQAFIYIAIGGVQSKLSLVAPPSAGSQPLTGVGFKPQSVLNMVMSSANQADSWGVAYAFGVADDALAQGYSISAGMNGGSTVKNRSGSETIAIGRTIFGASNAVAALQGTITSYDADGFTTNYSGADAIRWGMLSLAATPATQSITQIGNARIEKAFTLDQTGNARIEKSGTITQTGNARIEKTNSINQIGNATIESPFVQNTITQIGNARISKTNAITQVGNARISKVGSIDQIGNAFIQYQKQLQQVGNARISRVGTISQVGSAVIARQNTITQIGNATIVRINTISIIGNATITNPYPDKRPQRWDITAEKGAAEWDKDEKTAQEWIKSAEKTESEWAESNNKQNQQWSDSDNKHNTEWQRQFYD